MQHPSVITARMRKVRHAIRQCERDREELLEQAVEEGISLVDTSAADAALVDLYTNLANLTDDRRLARNWWRGSRVTSAD